MDELKQFFSNTRNMLYTLIGINVFIFVTNRKFILSGGELNILDMIGSIFSHANFGHLFFNMFGLYIFGSLIVRYIKSWQLLLLYLFSGILGNVVFVLFFREPYFALLGASGAVFGIMVAAAMLEPDQRFTMLFLPFFSLKTKTLMIVYTVMEVMSQLNGTTSGTAHLAHLGGIVGGLIITEIFLKKHIVWNPLGAKFNQKSRPKVKMQWKTYEKKSPTNPSDAVTPKELDYLLDKISKGGINALSNEELARLRQAREQINANKS